MDATALRALRARLDLTQTELAAHLGVHRVTLADWEGGASIPPPAARLLELIAASPRLLRNPILLLPILGPPDAPPGGQNGAKTGPRRRTARRAGAAPRPRPKRRQSPQAGSGRSV